MIEIKNTEVNCLLRSWKASGNPMTTGEIDTEIRFSDYGFDDYDYDPKLWEQSKERAKRLGRAPSGSAHDNFLSGILVTFDIKYPQYWSLEFQRYHFAQIVSSQSKMHRLTMMAKDEESFKKCFNKYVDARCIAIAKEYIDAFNQETDKDKKYTLFMQALSSLPMGFELWMTVTTNYLQLKTIYKQRKTHKLKEDWGAFCSWCAKLPNFLDLIGENSGE